MSPPHPLIVDIKRHSVEDGPGIRSVVFFKGCPLRCLFCHSPETQERGPEIAFSARYCLNCGECERLCPHGAIRLALPARIERARCQRCGRCAQVCPGKGLRLIGKPYPVEQLADILLRDRAFYHHSGGGVTLSGGECTLYPDYLEALLRLLKQHSVHVVLETSGLFDYQVFSQKVLPYLDLIYYDIKLADADQHEQFLGTPNQQILRNFRRLLSAGRVEVHPRIPLVPGMTATRENLTAIVEFLSAVGAERVSLLPYNPLGLDMYGQLGRRRPPLPQAFMKPEDEGQLLSMFETIIADRGRRTVLQRAERARPAVPVPVTLP